MDAYSLRKPLQVSRGPRSPPRASRPMSLWNVPRLDKARLATQGNHHSEKPALIGLAPQSDVYRSNTWRERSCWAWEQQRACSSW